MTEESMFWSDGLGDGGPYTQDQLRLLFDALTASEDVNRGVLVGQGSQLVPSSTGNNNIRMATGKAVVNGTLYENDAILDIVTTSPAIGTTGRRLVLQKDWTTRTVRAAIISSADGTASLPALTQNDGTTWEISIASFTITTGGVIGALTDTRELSGVSPPTQSARKTAQQNVASSTTLVDADDLNFSMGPNEIWAFQAFLISAGGTAGDIKIGFDVPAGATGDWAALSLPITGATGGDLSMSIMLALSAVHNSGLTAPGTDWPIYIWGTVENGAAGGDFQVQFAQVVSDAQASALLDNSWLKATRIS